MKKTKCNQWLVSLLTACLCAVLLVGCGSPKLDGTYYSQGPIAQTFTFDGDRVTMSAFGMNAYGTYEIENDKIRITYTMFGEQYVWEQPFSQSGNTINIGGTEFRK